MLDNEVRSLPVETPQWAAAQGAGDAGVVHLREVGTLNSLQVTADMVAITRSPALILINDEMYEADQITRLVGLLEAALALLPTASA